MRNLIWLAFTALLLSSMLVVGCGVVGKISTQTLLGKTFVNSQGDKIAFLKNGRAVELNHPGGIYPGQSVYFGEDGNHPRTECTYNQDGVSITLTCGEKENGEKVKAVFTVNKDGSLSGPLEGMWGESAFAHLLPIKQKD